MMTVMTRWNTPQHNQNIRHLCIYKDILILWVKDTVSDKAEGAEDKFSMRQHVPALKKRTINTPATPPGDYVTCLVIIPTTLRSWAREGIKTLLHATSIFLARAD